MTDPEFDLSQYKDDFEAKVRQMIEAKVAGQQVVAPPQVEEQPAVVNLMASLKESLARAQKVAKNGKPPRLAAPSAGSGREVRRRKSS